MCFFVLKKGKIILFENFLLTLSVKKTHTVLYIAAVFFNVFFRLSISQTRFTPPFRGGAYSVRSNSNRKPLKRKQIL